MRRCQHLILEWPCFCPWLFSSWFFLVALYICHQVEYRKSCRKKAVLVFCRFRRECETQLRLSLCGKGNNIFMILVVLLVGQVLFADCLAPAPHCGFGGTPSSRTACPPCGGTK
uniref:Uncharacterized protein n=1 Tax=Ixodes ricinus TaxID=34613 RepID=A0A6B0UKN4_IXORI